MKAPQKILVINGHPDKDSLVQTLANAYADSAKQSGHQVTQINVRELVFNINAHHPAVKQDLEVDLKTAQTQILEAQHLVVFYPIWWGGMPAALKGFFDRILTSGFAFRYLEKGMPEKLLTGRSVDIVNTSDTPSWLHWLLLKGDKLQVKRNIFEFCGVKVKRHYRFGPVFKSSEQQRERWIKRVISLAQQV